MPKIKTNRKKTPPEGWNLIEPTIIEIQQKLRNEESSSHEGKRKVESLWPILRLHHQQSRYIYDLFYKRKVISKELYDYCVKEKYADVNLIAKWRKNGYEKLCCLRCIQSKDTNLVQLVFVEFPKRN